MITRKTLIFLGLIIVLIVIGVGSYFSFFNKGTKPVQQQGQVAFLLSPAETTKSIGESFDVEVSIDGNDYDVSGIDMTLTFDKDKLELANYKGSETFSDILVNKPNNQAGTFRVVTTKSLSNRETGLIKVGTLTFKARAAGMGEVLFQNPLVTASGQDAYIPTSNNTTGKYEVKGGP